MANKTDDKPAPKAEAREAADSQAETVPLPPGPETAPSRSFNFRAYFRRWITIRDEPSALERILLGAACILVLLLIWSILTAGAPEERIITNVTLPSPAETARSMHSLWFDRALARSAAWSLGRVLGGFLLAAAIAVPLGVCAGAFRRLQAFLKPVSIFGRNIPIAALIPLTLIWFGLGETQKVMFIFCAAVAFVFFDTANAVAGVPNKYLDTAYTLGARFVPRHGLKWASIVGLCYGALFFVAYLALTDAPAANDNPALWAAYRHGMLFVALTGLLLGFLIWFPILAFQAVRKVLLALALPDIVNSMRLLFGLAFGYIMLAEVINAQQGLGSIIIMSQRRGPREHIYLCLIIIALVAFGIDRLILYLQRVLFPYRHTEGK